MALTDLTRRAIVVCCSVLLVTTGCATSDVPAGDDTAADTVWLCLPGVEDPCSAEGTITQVAADGTTTVERPRTADDPPIDCFYVYPTVSTQPRAVADRTVDAEQVAVATAQASRFSQVCRVFAPMYRQRTIGGIFGREATPTEAEFAYQDVRTAWQEYLRDHNAGRGVILIGHSQGSFVLADLIAAEIETDPEVAERLVSAMLLGGNVTVAAGSDRGGTFEHLPACTAEGQTGCVVAYSAFDGPPPPTAGFGVAGDGEQAICTNPAALGGGPAELHPAFVTGESLLGRVEPTPGTVDTAWVGYPGLFTAECRANATHSWLEVTSHRTGHDDPRPELPDALGADWGLHLHDVNVALDDLVALAARQGAAWDD